MIKVNVKFGCGINQLFLGQGYVGDGTKKVFVRLYTTSDMMKVLVKIYKHNGYSLKWDEAKECGLIAQREFKNGTEFTFDRMVMFNKAECYYVYSVMDQLSVVLNLMDFKLL